VDALLRDDAQAGILELGVDLAGQVAAVASGLMIERVRSVAMSVSSLPGRALGVAMRARPSMAGGIEKLGRD
jgi:hypothetical protein